MSHILDRPLYFVKMEGEWRIGVEYLFYNLPEGET